LIIVVFETPELRLLRTGCITAGGAPQ